MENNKLGIVEISNEIWELKAYLKDQQILSFNLIVKIGVFIKIYSRDYRKHNLPQHIQWFFGGLPSLFSYLQQNKYDEEIVVVHPDKGCIQIVSVISINGKPPEKRSAFLELQRQLEEQLNEIRVQIKDDADVRKSVEQLWRRQQENQKIFMKFKEEVEYKIQEVNERMGIQNTKIGIMREDINRISLYLEKLTQTVCPLLTKINIHCPYLQEFFLQDRKITYAGNSPSWTQILLNHSMSNTQKFTFTFKILNCKKGNIIVGVTKRAMQSLKSSLKKQKSMIAYSGNGILYKKSHQEKTGDGLTSMANLKMVIDLNNGSIIWKNGNKTVAETEIGELKGEEISPYIEFHDPGDALQIL